ncbi:hypothetical protein CEQ30_38125 [Nocardia brasiliensis]|nr:hypothetical protein CEQ30_38125 [Nocardia brasiliensis]
MVWIEEYGIIWVWITAEFFAKTILQSSEGLLQVWIYPNCASESRSNLFVPELESKRYEIGSGLAVPSSRLWIDNSCELRKCI